jgi:hypothetical protein
MIRIRILPVPPMVIAPINATLPGLDGLQAVSNAIRQVGMQCDTV